MNIELEEYINYLENKEPSFFCAAPKIQNDYLEIYIRKCEKEDFTLHEIFLDFVKKGNIVLVKKLLNDIRIEPNHLNNEAVILSILNDRMKILHLLLNNEKVDPSDQNNLALRLAIIQNNKPCIQMLLSHPRVKETLIYYPDILNSLG